ncbi:MAG: nucleotidyltransferase family protein [Dehalococcoidia bacterium]
MRSARLLRVGPEAVAAFCRRHHIRRLALFGSVLTREFRPDSDLDVLVEFEPGHTPGLAFFEMEEELSRLLDRKVDLNTPQFLSPRFRETVRAEAEVVFGPD